MKLDTLRKRQEFLRIRGGERWSCPPFVMEAKKRNETDEAGMGPRFGFTVTKKQGNAVMRNRIRRRLKSAVTATADTGARDHFDYVIVARKPARDMVFAELTDHMKRAFDRIHRPPGKGTRNRAQSGNSPHDHQITSSVVTPRTK